MTITAAAMSHVALLIISLPSLGPYGVSETRLGRATLLPNANEAAPQTDQWHRPKLVAEWWRS
jgi:hypothetical protein